MLAHASLAEECGSDPIRSRGVVCLAVPKGQGSVRFRVEDASGVPIGGSYYAYDAAGEFATLGAYCAGATVAAPAGGTLVVRMEVLSGPRACAAEGVPAAPPTRGLVSFLVG